MSEDPEASLLKQIFLLTLSDQDIRAVIHNLDILLLSSHIKSSFCWQDFKEKMSRDQIAVVL